MNLVVTHLLARSGAVLGMLMMVAACSAGAQPTSASISAAPPLVLDNSTPLALHLLVNGTEVGVAATNDELAVPRAQLPAYPWQVRAQTDSGRVLADMNVNGDVLRTALPDGGTEVHGYAQLVDLSCGQVVLAYGPPPAGGPAGASFAAGDCVP